MTEAYRNRRVALLKAMHEIVCDFNDESAYMSWIYLVPDCPTEQDFIDMAESDEDMDSAVKLFFSLIERHGKYGLCVQGDWDLHEFKTFGESEVLEEEE